jgi:hypothetical protein
MLGLLVHHLTSCLETPRLSFYLFLLRCNIMRIKINEDIILSFSKLFFSTNGSAVGLAGRLKTPVAPPKIGILMASSANVLF